jgi:hypothetical protein
LEYELTPVNTRGVKGTVGFPPNPLIGRFSVGS